MKLLIFGANSQLGRELTRLLADAQVDFTALNSDEVDVLKPKDVMKAVSRINPTQLINVSTYSNLQKAENDPDAAKMCDLINTEGVAALARVCNQLSIPMLHHSSSYVFDGQKKETYEEDDETNPQCSYGRSKWYGERTLREETEKHIILRTDWLFSSYRDNYFRALINSVMENAGKISVVDNRFSPTPATDVARVILGIINQVDCHAEVWGTYHYNALQPVNQDQFVLHVLEEAVKLDKTLEKLMPALDMQLLPVESPYIRNSALNCGKIMSTFGIKQRSRGDGVTGVLEGIYGVKKAENESSTSVRAGLKKRARTGKAASSKDTANGTDINTNATQKVKAKRKKTSPKKPPQQKQRAKKVATRK